MIILPYEIIEMLFGTWVADNFNTIARTLMVIGFIIWLIMKHPRIYRNNNEQKPKQSKKKRINLTRKHNGNEKRKNEPKWYPTGWYWDEKKQSWIPPDYLSKESNERWKWNEEKQIWIDTNKKI